MSDDRRDEWQAVGDDPPPSDRDAVETMLSNGLVIHDPLDQGEYVYSDTTMVLEDQAEPIPREGRRAPE
jgi:hypothetical protein